MPQFAAVSRERHANKKWLRYTNLAFTAGEAIAPIVGTELAHAALAMPCAFVQQSGRYVLAAVLSFPGGRNMFVAPDGRWLGRYIPAVFRLYPFLLRPSKGTDGVVLCVDEESKLVVDGNSAGEEFFDAQGNPATVLKPVFEVGMALERGANRPTWALRHLPKPASSGPGRSKSLPMKANDQSVDCTGPMRQHFAAFRMRNS